MEIILINITFVSNTYARICTIVFSFLLKVDVFTDTQTKSILCDNQESYRVKGVNVLIY